MVGSFLYIFWCSEVLQGFKKTKQTKQTKPQQKAKQTENEIALKFSVIQCSEHSWDNLYPVHHPQKSSTNPLPRKNNKNKIKTKKTNKQNKQNKQTTCDQIFSANYSTPKCDGLR